MPEPVHKGNTGRYQFCDATFYNALHRFWILQLIADGDTKPCSYQFRQIRINGMVGKTSQLNMTFSVGSFGKHNTENLRCLNSIGSKSFIKISDTKQQQSIRILLLNCIVLRHQRSFFLCHCFWGKEVKNTKLTAVLCQSLIKYYPHQNLKTISKVLFLYKIPDEVLQ